MTLEEGDVILTGPRHLILAIPLPNQAHPCVVAFSGTPQGVGPVTADDKITAGLETESGESLSVIQHLVKNREGGYLFKQK